MSLRTYIDKMFPLVLKLHILFDIFDHNYQRLIFFTFLRLVQHKNIKIVFNLHFNNSLGHAFVMNVKNTQMLHHLIFNCFDFSWLFSHKKLNFKHFFSILKFSILS